MRKVALVVTLTTGLAAAAVSGAAAYEGTLEPAGSFVLDSSLLMEFEGGGVTVFCQVTLGGSLEESISNIETAWTHLGEIDEMRFANCLGGSVRTVLGLPWELLGRGMSGTLPNSATSLQFEIDGMEVQFSVYGGFVNCLYSGDLLGEFPAWGGNPYDLETVNAISYLTKVSGSLCPASTLAASLFWLSPSQELTIS